MSFLKKTAAACLTLVCVFCMAGNTAWAHLNKTILFVPHDNRPISFKQTADNIRDLGYEVLTPPEELLGNREKPQGNPEGLADWVVANAKKADAVIQVNDVLDLIEMVETLLTNPELLEAKRSLAYNWAASEAKVLDGIVEKINAYLE